MASLSDEDEVDANSSDGDKMPSDGSADESPEDEPASLESSNRVTVDERADLVSSLEHIVAVGSHVFSTEQRTKEWRGKQTSKLRHDNKIHIGVAERVGDEDQLTVPPVATRLLHAEDYRIFGKDGSVGQGMLWKWPQSNRRGRKRVRDDEWDIEHGDGINQLAFTEARLSQEIQTQATKRSKLQEEDLSLDRTCVTVADKEIPRALVLHCWEHAVHAASCTVLCNSGEEKTNPISSSGQNQSTTEHCAWSHAAAVRKCSLLNIDLPFQEPFLCPACKCELDSSDSLSQHFFGSKKQRGCSWSLIRTNQQTLIDKVMQEEVVTLVEGLVHTILSCTKCSVAKRRGASDERSKAFDWQDVMRFLEFALSSSTSTTRTPSTSGTGALSVLNTLSVQPDMVPVLLNKDVLDAASRRLIERYAIVQRRNTM